MIIVKGNSAFPAPALAPVATAPVQNQTPMPQPVVPVQPEPLNTNTAYQMWLDKANEAKMLGSAVGDLAQETAQTLTLRDTNTGMEWDRHNAELLKEANDWVNVWTKDYNDALAKGDMLTAKTASDNLNEAILHEKDIQLRSQMPMSISQLLTQGPIAQPGQGNPLAVGTREFLEDTRMSGYSLADENFASQLQASRERKKALQASLPLPETTAGVITQGAARMAGPMLLSAGAQALSKSPAGKALSFALWYNQGRGQALDEMAGNTDLSKLTPETKKKLDRMASASAAAYSAVEFLNSFAGTKGVLDVGEIWKKYGKDFLKTAPGEEGFKYWMKKIGNKLVGYMASVGTESGEEGVQQAITDFTNKKAAPEIMNSDLPADQKREVLAWNGVFKNALNATVESFAPLTLVGGATQAPRAVIEMADEKKKEDADTKANVLNALNQTYFIDTETGKAGFTGDRNAYYDDKAREYSEAGAAEINQMLDDRIRQYTEAFADEDNPREREKIYQRLSQLVDLREKGVAGKIAKENLTAVLKGEETGKPAKTAKTIAVPPPIPTERVTADAVIRLMDVADETTDVSVPINYMRKMKTPEVIKMARWAMDPKTSKFARKAVQNDVFDELLRRGIEPEQILKDGETLTPTAKVITAKGAETKKGAAPVVPETGYEDMADEDMRKSLSASIAPDKLATMTREQMIEELKKEAPAAAVVSQEQPVIPDDTQKKAKIKSALLQYRRDGDADKLAENLADLGLSYSTSGAVEYADQAASALNLTQRKEGEINGLQRQEETEVTSSDTTPGIDTGAEAQKATLQNAEAPVSSKTEDQLIEELSIVDRDLKKAKNELKQAVSAYSKLKKGVAKSEWNEEIEVARQRKEELQAKSDNIRKEITKRGRAQQLETYEFYELANDVGMTPEELTYTEENNPRVFNRLLEARNASRALSSGIYDTEYEGSEKLEDYSDVLSGMKGRKIRPYKGGAMREDWWNKIPQQYRAAKDDWNDQSLPFVDQIAAEFGFDDVDAFLNELGGVGAGNAKYKRSRFRDMTTRRARAEADAKYIDEDIARMVKAQKEAYMEREISPEEEAGLVDDFFTGETLTPEEMESQRAETAEVEVEPLDVNQAPPTVEASKEDPKKVVIGSDTMNPIEINVDGEKDVKTVNDFMARIRKKSGNGQKAGQITEDKRGDEDIAQDFYGKQTGNQEDLLGNIGGDLFEKPVSPDFKLRTDIIWPDKDFTAIPPAAVSAEKYEIDAIQHFAVNMMLDRLDAGENSYFLLGDGTGTGKTSSILVTANELQMKYGGRVLIVIPNRELITAGSYKQDAARLGIDLGKFEFMTYRDTVDFVKNNPDYKKTSTRWNTIVFDEAHKLKNVATSQSAAGDALMGRADRVILATSTPMDNPFNAAYFLSKLSGMSEQEVSVMLGYELVEKVDKNGQIQRHIKLRPNFTMQKCVQNLLAIRRALISESAMIRREYPFKGEVRTVNIELDQTTRDKHDEVEKFWDKEIENTSNFNKKKAAGSKKKSDLEHIVEPAKVEHTMNEIKVALNRGRQVIVAFEWVSDYEMAYKEGGEESIIPASKKIMEALKAAGIDYARVFGEEESHRKVTGEKTTRKAREALSFQRGEKKVVLMTFKSGGTGINLDDITGEAPRTMIILSAGNSGDNFDQAIGRVNRKTTQSDSEIIVIQAPESSREARNKTILANKMAILRAIQKGEDVDSAGFHRNFGLTQTTEEGKADTGTEVEGFVEPPEAEYELKTMPTEKERVKAKALPEEIRRKIRSPLPGEEPAKQELVLELEALTDEKGTLLRKLSALEALAERSSAEEISKAISYLESLEPVSEGDQKFAKRVIRAYKGILMDRGIDPVTLRDFVELFDSTIPEVDNVGLPKLPDGREDTETLNPLISADLGELPRLSADIDADIKAYHIIAEDISKQNDDEFDFDSDVEEARLRDLSETDQVLNAPYTATRLSTKDKTPAGTRRVNIKQISIAMMRAARTIGINTLIRTRRVYGKSALGQFSGKTFIIRMKDRRALSTLCHEFGHLLDWYQTIPDINKRLTKNITDKSLQSELVEMGKALYGARKPNGGYGSEGFAEFMRLYLTGDDATINRDAPLTRDWFEKQLKPTLPKKFLKELNIIRNMATNYKNQGALKRARAETVNRILGVFEDAIETIKGASAAEIYDDAVTNWFEEFHLLNTQWRKMLMKNNYNPALSKDPYSVASAFRGTAAGVAHTMYSRYMVDLWGNKTGGSFRQACERAHLKSSEDVTAFGIFLHAMEAVERYRQKQQKEDLQAIFGSNVFVPEMNPGMKLEDAQYIIDQAPQDWLAAADDINDWFDNLLRFRVQSGAMSQDVYNKIKKVNRKYYAPLYREFSSEELAAIRNGVGRQAGNSMKKFNGSSRRVMNPMYAIPGMIQKTVEDCHLAYLKNLIVEQADMFRGMGFMIEKIKPNSQRVTATLGQIKQTILDAGLADIIVKHYGAQNMDEVIKQADGLLDFNTRFNIFFPVKAQDKEAYVYQHVDPSGKKQYYLVDKELFDILQGVGDMGLLSNMKVYASPGARILAAAVQTAAVMPVRAFVAGTTGFSADFLLGTNLQRDIPGAMAFTRSKDNFLKHFYNLTRNYLQAILVPLGGKSSEARDLYLAKGLQSTRSMSMFTDEAESATYDVIEGVPARLYAKFFKRGGSKSVMGTVKTGLDYLSELAQFSESAPRINEMEAILKDMGWDGKRNLTPDESIRVALAARRITADWMAGGKWAKSVRKVIPYFGSSIQGPRWAFYNMRELMKTKEGRSRLLLRGFLMYAVPALFYWWRNKDEEWYKDLSAETKNRYFHIKIGSQVIRIAKHQELGLLFANTLEMLANMTYQPDPKAFMQRVKAAGYQMVPPSPLENPVAKAIFEQFVPKPNSMGKGWNRFQNKPIVSSKNAELDPGAQRNIYTSWLAGKLGDWFPSMASPERIDHAISTLTGRLGGSAADLFGIRRMYRSAMGKDSAFEREVELSDIPIVSRWVQRGGLWGSRSVAVDELYDTKQRMEAPRNTRLDKGIEIPKEEEAYYKLLSDATEAVSALSKLQSITRDNARRQEIQMLKARIAKHAVGSKGNALNLMGRSADFLNDRAKNINDLRNIMMEEQNKDNPDLDKIKRKFEQMNAQATKLLDREEYKKPLK